MTNKEISPAPAPEQQTQGEPETQGTPEILHSAENLPMTPVGLLERYEKAAIEAAETAPRQRRKDGRSSALSARISLQVAQNNHRKYLKHIQKDPYSGYSYFYEALKGYMSVLEKTTPAEQRQS